MWCFLHTIHILFGGWFGPACAYASLRKQIPFLTMQQKIAEVMQSNTTTQLKTIAKALFLVASLAIIWLAVMLTMRWYDPGFHLLATSVSAVVATTSDGWGIVEKLAA